ncbi:MAG: ATP synthase F0 subunit C [Deltaproteobacteria bacterium]|nr:ATP synthase F0 subunit C [Deltaproteobacteria bacterium]
MKRIKTFVYAVAAFVASTLVATPALAADGGGANGGLIAVGAGICMGVAALGAGLGQGRAVASAMESIGRNPNSADRIQIPMIIGIAFMEALGIYALVVAFLLVGKI